VESVRFDHNVVGENLNNEPTEPTEPDRPVEPTTPVEPDAPATPVEPAAPTTPYEPAVPAVPLPPTSVDAGTPGPPTGPPTGPPAPPRKGLPGWAWALIIGAAVVMIAVIVVVVIVVNTVLGAVAGDNSAAEPTAVPTSAGTESAPATEAATPSATPTAKPTKAADAGSGTAISLDEHIDLGTPFWSFPIEDGWVMRAPSEAGVQQADNAELGCLFTTNQLTMAPFDTAATGDRSDTESGLQSLEQQMLGAADKSEVIPGAGSVEIANFLAGGSETIEFAASRVEYVDADDVAYTNDFAARAMPKGEAFLFYNVSCPTAVIDAGNSPFEQLTEKLAVVFE
jgi:hypothetical protein